MSGRRVQDAYKGPGRRSNASLARLPYLGFTAGLDPARLVRWRAVRLDRWRAVTGQRGWPRGRWRRAVRGFAVRPRYTGRRE